VLPGAAWVGRQDDDVVVEGDGEAGANRSTRVDVHSPMARVVISTIAMSPAGL
jgi:hypothetical protein